jgi:hypothetical protein
MTFCSVCGTQTAADDNYCARCGDDVNLNTPSAKSTSLLHKLKTTTDQTVKKGLEVGKKASDEIVDIGKKGVNKVRVAVSDDEDPLKILKIRFVKGEITKAEYEDMKAMIS